MGTIRTGSRSGTARSSTGELVAALRRAGLSDVSDRAVDRAAYSSDASAFRVVPAAVARPRDAAEAEAALAVCREAGIPVTARGAGTSIAGNAVGTGLVLDFSRHMNRVLNVDAEAMTATVQPGLVQAELHRQLPAGLRFGPDPSSHTRCTIGGMIGNNACGSRALRYGRTSDNVLALDVLTAAGRPLRMTGPVGLTGHGGEAPELAALRKVINSGLAPIRTELGRFGRQVSGYALEHLLPENGFDVRRALVGSEGTLALLTQATLRLVREPACRVLAVAGYPDMASAADAAPGFTAHEPTACEGLDSRITDVVRAQRGAGAVDALPPGSGWLFTEFAAGTAAEAEALARRALADAGTGATGTLLVTDPWRAAALWRIREDGAGLGSRTPDGAPAWPGWEDSAVPPDKLPGYLRELVALMARHQVDGLMYGHFGDGCVHVRIDFPLRDRPAVLREFTQDAARLAAGYGGSASGEHGDGRARGELLPAMYSAEAIGLFGAVKRIFDPASLLNPGVVVAPAPLDADLRVPAARPLRSGLGFAYPNDRGDFAAAVHRCVGVGKCRADTTGTGGVMCPSFLATRDEKDSTRGRARVLQELANGSLVRDWRAPEITEALDLCLSCKGCSSDCPVGVDMATYKAEALYQRYRRRLRPAAHYSLGWLPRWAALASRAPWLANGSLRVRPVAAAAKRLGGIDERRPLPAFARQSFRRWFTDRRTGASQSGPSQPAVGDGSGGQPSVGAIDGRKPVLLWMDTFTNAFTPEVGRAAVAVLEAAGYEVRITPRQVCCGLTWISTGQLDGARRQLRRTLRALGPALDEGIPIVGLEPSCTAALRADAAELLPGEPRAKALGAAVTTLAELLRATDGWTPPDLSDVRGVAQPHCHQHATGGWDADAALLAAAGAQVSSVGGCCGLAGNFGVERGHYDVSAAIAETALLPAVRAAGQGATVLADGFSCRTQLDQLADVKGTHLAELLASRLQAQR